MTVYNKALGLCLALSAACFASIASAASVVGFDVPNSVSTFVEGQDNDGNVVGTYQDHDQNTFGFVRRKDGSFHLYDQAGDPEPFAMAPNGKIAGVLGQQLFVGDLDGALESFTVKNIPIPQVTAVSTKGAVVGWGPWKTSTGPYHAYLRRPNGKVITFTAPGAGTASHQGTRAVFVTASGIVDGNVIDGAGVQHGFIRDAAGGFTVFDPPGATRTSVHQMLEDGTMAGIYYDAQNNPHAFLRAPDGTITTVDAPSVKGTNVVGINKKSAMAGSTIDFNGVGHGLVRAANGQFKTFDAPGAGTVSGVGTFAYYINDKGQVAGITADNNGTTHGFVRLP